MMRKVGWWMLVALMLTGCGRSAYEQVKLETVESVGEVAAAGRTEAGSAEAAMGQAEAGTGENTGNPEVEIVIGETTEPPAQIMIEPEKALDETRDAAGAEASAESGEEALASIRLLFGGDVLLSDHVLNAWQQAGGISGVLDEHYRALIADADYFVVNEEFPFSSRGTKAEDKQYTFRLPPEKVELFHQMGIDGVTLANNHALDYGQEALLDTCQVLDDAGILRTGAGKDLEEACQPMILEASGKSIAVIGATRVIPVSDWAAGANHPGMLATYDPSLLLEQIRKLHSKYDYVIVYVHWGIERDEMPQDYQRGLGKQYIDAGADLVIGAHPHVLQGIEYYQGKPIVYSLGNFVFGSSIPRTMLLEVELDGEGEGTGRALQLRVYPGTSSAGYTRMHTDPQAREEAYQYLEQISFDVQISEDGVTEPQLQP